MTTAVEVSTLVLAGCAAVVAYRVRRTWKKTKAALALMRAHEAWRQDVGDRNRARPIVSDPDPTFGTPRPAPGGEYWPTAKATRLLHGDEGGGGQ